MSQKRKIYLTINELLWIQDRLANHYFIDNVRDVLRLLSSKVPLEDEKESN